MKAQFRFSLVIVAIVTCLVTTACGGGSSSDASGDDGGGGASSTISLQDATVAPNASVNLIPTGGVPPYTFTLQSAIGGTVVNNSTYATFTAGGTTGSVRITVTDTANASVTATVTVAGAPGALVVSPLTATVAAGGSVNYVVSGGVPPYTYTASAGTFVGAKFTAPSSAQTVTVTISDSATHNVTATVTVTGGGGGTPPAAASCGGTYQLNLAGYPGTLSIVQSSSGTIAGSIQLTGYGGAAAISGTCTAGGSITFTDLYSGSPYSGTYFVNPNTHKNVMTGTFTQSGSTYSWFAIQQ